MSHISRTASGNAKQIAGGSSGAIAGSGPRRRRLRIAREFGWGALFVAPPIIIYTVFEIYPIIRTIYISGFKWDIISNVRHPVGLGNFAHLFFHDSTFRVAMKNTGIWTVLYVPGALVGGLVAALVLNRNFRGRTFLRVVIYLPFVVSNVAAGLMWQFIYYPQLGLADVVSRHLGLGDVLWLADRQLALYSVLIAFLWQGIGAMMIIFLAGLQSVPSELLEAAQVEGASAWQRLHLITIPLLRESTIVAGSLAFITSLNVFNIIFVMTNGGPGDATQVLGTLTYYDSFQFGQFGQGSAIATVLVIVVLLLGVPYVRRTTRERFS